jgi:hypothetical protein
LVLGEGIEAVVVAVKKKNQFLQHANKERKYNKLIHTSGGSGPIIIFNPLDLVQVESSRRVCEVTVRLDQQPFFPRFSVCGSILRA